MSAFSVIENIARICDRDNGRDHRRPFIHMMELLKNPVTESFAKPWDQQLMPLLRSQPLNRTLLCVNSWEQVEYMRRHFYGMGWVSEVRFLSMIAEPSSVSWFEDTPNAILVVWPEDPAGNQSFSTFK